jgi:hypothetical protein
MCLCFNSFILKIVINIRDGEEKRKRSTVQVTGTLNIISHKGNTDRNHSEPGGVVHTYHHSRRTQIGGHPELHSEFKASLGYKVRLCFNSHPHHKKYPQWDTTSHLLRWLQVTLKWKISMDEVVEKLGPLCVASGKPCQSRSHIMRFCSHEMCSKCRSMLRESRSVVAKGWGEGK